MNERIFKTKSFARWLKKAGLSDAALMRTVAEIQKGLVEANLGGGVLKARIAQPGRGKSGSTRTLLATNLGNRWFFIYGFAKKDMANIPAAELVSVKQAAEFLLEATPQTLTQLIAESKLEEIKP